jgi:hypothetical protein
MHPVWYFVLWQHLTHLYFIENTVTLPIYFDSLVGPGSSHGPDPQGFLYHCSNKLRGAFFVTFGINQDGSYPFLIPPASRTGDRVLELLLINIDSN